MSHFIRSLVALAIVTGTVSAQGPTTFCFPNTQGVMNCPCNNPPLNPGQQGCDNFAFGTTGTGGATLMGFGNTSMANDTLTLSVFGENSGVFTLLLESTNANNSGLVYGAAIRCITAPIHRVYGLSGFRQNTNGQASWGAGAGDPPMHADIGAFAGLTTFFQAWYRDPNAINHCSAPATFNASNAVVVFWNP